VREHAIERLNDDQRDVEDRRQREGGAEGCGRVVGGVTVAVTMAVMVVCMAVVMMTMRALYS
jgi:hypothetical protein